MRRQRGIGLQQHNERLRRLVQLRLLVGRRDQLCPEMEESLEEAARVAQLPCGLGEQLRDVNTADAQQAGELRVVDLEVGGQRVRCSTASAAAS